MKELLKLQKGHFGYIHRKKLRLLAGILFFAAGIAGFLIIGIVTAGSRRNLLTVASVLLVLPMAKLLVILIALWPFSGRPKEEYDKVASAAGGAVFDTELVITSAKDKTFCVDYCVFTDTQALCYCAERLKEPKRAEEYLNGYLEAHDLPCRVHLFHDFKAYIRRISSENLPARADCSDEVLKAEGVLRGLSI